MKNFALGFLTTIAVVSLATFGYLRMGLAEVRNDVSPPAWESRLVKLAVEASVRRRARRDGNFAPPSDARLIAGGKLYRDGCAGCHGQLGKPVRSFAEWPPAPQFLRDGTAFEEPELIWIVKHGIRRTGMSAYGRFYSDPEIRDLAAFVKRMNQLSPAVFEGIQKKSP